MKLKSIISLTVLFSGLTCFIALLIYNKFYTTKTAYIEIKKVFNGFLMKAELEEKYKHTQKGRDKILDSLAFELKLISKHLSEQKNAGAKLDKEELYGFEYKRDGYLKIKSQYQEDNVALSKKYDEQILMQLTQYVMEFGKKRNYDIIWGADGNGSLMYARDLYNISDEVIVFINNRYKGID